MTHKKEVSKDKKDYDIHILFISLRSGVLFWNARTGYNRDWG